MTAIFFEHERTMPRKLALIAAALLLSSAAAFCCPFFVVGLQSPILWAQRQLAIMSVRGGPEVVLEVDAEAVRRRAHELLRRDVVSLLRGAHG